MTSPLRARLRRLADASKARSFARFFRAEHRPDRFLGIITPDLRRVVAEIENISLSEIAGLLRSRVHEERVAALMILVRRFEREPDRIFRFYLRHLNAVNNWDLVDLSAPAIVGAWLFDRDRSILDRWARSKNLWRRRVAIVTTQHFIRRGQTADTFRLARRLLDDSEDLIHKATGWMLREAGKRDPEGLSRFLRAHGRRMPRTMLRFAIERYPPARRRAILAAFFHSS